MNITNIPAPRVPFIDERTGLMAREWYRFFLNLFILTGSGSNPTTLDELQIGPPNQPDLTELLIQINKDIAPQYEDQSGDFLKTLDTAQLMSMMSRFENAEAAIQGAYLQPAQLPVDGIYVVGPGSSTDNAVARFDGTTGKLIQNSVTTIDDTGAATGFTTFAASTSVTTPTVQASNSAGLSLKNASGTTQINTGAGGGDNVSINVSTNLNGVNAQIDISPTGTGHVHIKPSGTGSIEIAPTNVGTIDNMTIGATAPKNGSFVDLSVTGTLSFDAAQGTAGQVLTSAGSGATPTWTTPTTGTVTSVAALTLGTTGTDLSSTVANGTTTPVITLQVPTASASNRGALSAADWTTFNNKGSGTVTSVTGTAPVVSSGGATPAISMAAATTSVNGYLTSTDWTTFNNKGSGTVTSVAATVPSIFSISGSPITTSGTLAMTYSGTALPVANGGTGLTSVPHTVTIYTSGSGTYTTPANCKAIYVKMVGGGGNGGASTGITAGGGGGAGGYLEVVISGPSATYTYAVGAAGGNTTFNGSTYSANAGTAGTSSSATASGGAGGTATGGNLNITGATGGFGWASAPYFSGGYGAGSPFGSGGSGGGTGFGNGFSGVVYGSGGGGAVGGGAAGNGVGGLIVITEVYV